jgi:hypothetical protein
VCVCVDDAGAGAAVGAGFYGASVGAEDPGVESCTCRSNHGVERIASAPTRVGDVSTVGWLACCSDAGIGEIAYVPISCRDMSLCCWRGGDCAGDHGTCHVSMVKVAGSEYGTEAKRGAG